MMTSTKDYPDSGKAQRYADALRKASEGSLHALDELVEEFSGMLWRVARRQGLDAASAEDVVQTTWLHLVRSVTRIESPAALPGWLATTAKYESWKVGKQAGRERPVGEDWELPTPPHATTEVDAAQHAELSERQRQLWQAVSELSPRCRYLLEVVAYVDRPDYAQVAEALDVPRGSIGPYRGRCLSQLRERLGCDPRSDSSEGSGE